MPIIIDRETGAIRQRPELTQAEKDRAWIIITEEKAREERENEGL